MPYLLIRVMLRFGRIWPTSPAACQVVPQVSGALLQQQHVGLAELGEVVGGGAADDAAADDDDAGLAGEGHGDELTARHRPTRRCADGAVDDVGNVGNTLPYG